MINMDKFKQIFHSNLGFVSFLLTALLAITTPFIDSNIKSKDDLIKAPVIISAIIFFLYIAIELYRNYLQNLPLLQKMEKQLLDFDGWEKSETELTNWHYKSAPEFTVCFTGKDRPFGGPESWVRAATNPKADVWPIQLKYHQTVLKAFDCVYFDGGRELIPAPDEKLSLIDEKLIFFFTAQTFKFSLLQFLLNADKSENEKNIKFPMREKLIYRFTPQILKYSFLQSLLKISKSEVLRNKSNFIEVRDEEYLIKNGIKDRTRTMPIVIFSSKDEKDMFFQHLEKTKIDYSSSKYLKIYTVDYLVTEDNIENIAYLYEVIEELKRFRKSKYTKKQ